MEMTRRKFIARLIAAGLALIAGAFRLAKKAVPRTFVRAAPLNHYPGKLTNVSDVSKQSRWSG